MENASAIRLEFDWRVESGFLYLGRWPIALMQAIGDRKAEMFAALQTNPLAPDQLIATCSFVVEGSEFHVTFGANKRLMERHTLRVLYIEPS